MSHAVAYAELPALPITPAWARRHAHAVLGAWQITPDATEVAVLLISELVTNAVAATMTQADHNSAAAAPIIQTIRRQPGQIIIEITDNNPSPPAITDAGPDAESGRGLVLVQALAKSGTGTICPKAAKPSAASYPSPAMPTNH